jgi:hypothetical protein
VLTIGAVPVASAGAPTDGRADEGPWQVLVPAGTIGRFDIRIERASLDDEPDAVAARLASRWRSESGVALRSSGGQERRVSRWTEDALELVTLSPSAGGGSEARRSVFRLRDPGRSSERPSVLDAFVALGPPLGGLDSRDAGRDGLTRVWLVDGGLAEAARRIERMAARQGLRVTMRFTAPDDAPGSVRHAQVIALAGAGNSAVITLAPQGRQVAVVVHCQVIAP